MRELKISKSAQKELEKTDLPTKKRIVRGITQLLNEPPQGDIKPLKGELGGLYRLRVGSWRITFEIMETSINILNISPRGGAYK